MTIMASFTDNGLPAAVSTGRGFHLVNLIPCVCRDAEPTVEARLCEIEEAVNAWLRAKIAEIESTRSAHKHDGMISHVCDQEKEVVMSKDDRDGLELLRTELDFLEKGGYGRSVRTPWKPTSPFRDSLTCVNYALPEKAHPCSECHLIDFVPPDHLADELPCHHIPLNAEGDTAEDLEGDQSKLEEALKEWLRAKIKEIETASLGAEQES
jgi:hypothetical protein